MCHLRFHKTRFAAALALGVLGGCGKKSSETSSIGGSIVTVKGSLADWPSAVGSFKDYSVLLYNIDTGEVKRAAIGASSTGFSIENVNTAYRYYAMLLDPEFRFGWVLQMPSQTRGTSVKNYQAFRFAGTGNLGSLTAEGRVLRTSEQKDLVPVENIVFKDTAANGIPDGFEADSAEFASSSNTSGDLDADGISDAIDPDIDNDGIPNVVDNDIDNDGIVNILDSKNGQYTLEDKESSWINNPLVTVPGGNVFRYVFSEYSNASSSALQGITILPAFTAPPGEFAQVAVSSGSFLAGATYSIDGAAFDGKLYDDGTHGDGVAGDGQWSVPVKLAAGKTFSATQVMFFKGTRADGSVSEYVVNMGTLLTGTTSPAVLVSAATYDATTEKATITWTATTAAQTQYQVLIFNAAGARVYTSELISHDVLTLEIPSAFIGSSGTYSVEVRALAPSPRNGFPGSSWRSAGVALTIP
jgi:hypothetical protein